MITVLQPAFEHWLKTAGRGARIEYHRGFLSRDRSAETLFSALAPGHRRQLLRTARAALQASREGRVALCQKRHGAGDYSYYAVRL